MKAGFLAFWLSGLATLTACDQAGAPVDEASAAPAASAVAVGNVQAATAALQAEPKILDLVYDPDLAVEWTIGVADDGSRRVGYAEYVCSVLREHGALTPDADVRVVDYHRFMANGGDARGASLGHVECATGRDLGV